MNIIPWRRNDHLTTPSIDLEDLWSRFWRNGQKDFANNLPEVFRAQSSPAMNIAESEDDFNISLDCPGLEEEDFTIEAMGNQLLISGERKWEEEKKGKEFRRVESQFGRFERTVELPDNVRSDPDKIEATYKKGILRITVPKLEKTPASRIPVHAE